MADALLKEDGFYLLKEDGGKILLEPISGGGGNGGGGGGGGAGRSRHDDAQTVSGPLTPLPVPF